MEPAVLRKSVVRLLKPAVSVASILFVLLSFEIGLRVRAALAEPIVRDPRVKVRTRNIIRLSRNPRIIYELIPGLHATYKNAVVSVNADGMRGPLVPKQRRGAEVRIAGIGDSFMFGFGVGDSTTLGCSANA